MIDCIAVDDEPPALALISQYASGIPELNLSAMYGDPVEAKGYLERNRVDLLFLDIRMHDVTGLDFFRSLPVQPLVVFTTAYRKYAVESFEVNAVDYLLKPFSRDRFQKAVTRALEISRFRKDGAAQEQFLYFHMDSRLTRVPLKEIYYIESHDNYSRIYTSRRAYMTLIPLKSLLEKLPISDFIRVHRSFIIAVDKVEYIQFRKVGLVGGIEIPIGDTFRSRIPLLKRP